MLNRIIAWWNRPPAMQRLLAAMSETEWRKSLVIINEADVSIAFFYTRTLRLEEEGLVESKWEEMPTPRRRLYKLTFRGRLARDRKASTSLATIWGNLAPARAQ